jgi:aspartyl-tRNA(Asn)/glutamyl-tRNA(Gln) amidotransferase subunit C
MGNASLLPTLVQATSQKLFETENTEEKFSISRGADFTRPIDHGKLNMSEKISREEVRHVAVLARLDQTESEEERMTGQMNQILGYMDKLNELDTTGVPATTHATQLQNVFRPDGVAPSLDREEALANAPETDGTNFVVPKVI